MSSNSVSSTSSATRPSRFTCRYQLSASSTVSDRRGSRRRNASLARLSSMFRSTREPSHRYHVATECGEPSGRTVATTAGLGRRRSSSTSGGNGSVGTARFVSDSRPLERWRNSGTFAPVATILLVGVDLFFRGKLEGLLPGHRLVTSDSVDEPDLVIADIARVEPDEVVDAWPDIPILGFTNHTDKAGLQRAHTAGFDQVIVKSALVERAPDLVAELSGSGVTDPS